jgi:hypothetical protein
MKTNINFNSPKRLRLIKYFIVFVMLLCINLSPLTAQEPPKEENNPVVKTNEASMPKDSVTTIDPDLNKVIKVIFVFLVLSIVFESALTPIFNWRFFLAHFDGKGIKTFVTLITAFLVFKSYNLDIFKDVLVALGYQAKLSLGGQILTTFLIAGGSNGIFQIFTKLNIRNLEETKRKKEEAVAELKKKKEESATKEKKGNS